uniref:Uncharacterized protein n=1 Tax=Nelumbo nucifera TaxID=4432 RepID=A0A822YYD7_NELNU|nr:TPA_asm: hypothetical protein HUJ06_008161 [Nelumbo nucifera]
MKEKGTILDVAGLIKSILDDRVKEKGMMEKIRVCAFVRVRAGEILQLDQAILESKREGDDGKFDYTGSEDFPRVIMD